MKSVTETIKKVNGHYSIGMPLRDKNVVMPKNKCDAEHRASNLKRKRVCPSGPCQNKDQRLRETNRQVASLAQDEKVSWTIKDIIIQDFIIFYGCLSCGPHLDWSRFLMLYERGQKGIRIYKMILQFQLGNCHPPHDEQLGAGNVSAVLPYCNLASDLDIILFR